ncbi:MAG: hypothetical protein GF403_04600 [Candidatus Coatesbacteria bacterium]|nr:hypothetical protein [Candidatus Coatesbacteria bacterium]
MRTNGYSIVIRSRVESLAHINHFVKRVGRLHQLESRVVDDVTLAVYEGCANVIEHAYNGDESREIRIELRVDADELTVFIFDDGPFFLPEVRRSPGVEELVDTGADGGFGLMIMERLMDVIERYSRNGYNVLEMRKQLERR